MNSKRFLIQLRYLGFRYHGVQKQPGFSSIQEKIETVLSKDLKGKFQTRFSSRTDALVSSLDSYCLLMSENSLTLESVQKALSRLPPDIEMLEVRCVGDDFILLKELNEKEYRYYFCFNQKNFHPFASAFMTHIREELNLEIMKEAALLFCGQHDFVNYAYKLKEGVDSHRSILVSLLEQNEDFTGSFFPEKSYVFKVRGHGFMRGQVRAMMGALFRVGKGELSLPDLKKSLKEEDSTFVQWLAPASGLILHETKMK